MNNVLDVLKTFTQEQIDYCDYLVMQAVHIGPPKGYENELIDMFDRDQRICVELLILWANYCKRRIDMYVAPTASNILRKED